MKPKWRAGGTCPLEDCNFTFAIGSDEEIELDLVGQAMMQAHSDHSHEGLPVNLFGYKPAAPIDLPVDDSPEPEERPRLIN